MADACCQAWNALVAEKERITSLQLPRALMLAVKVFSRA
jgi:hypothetical protein